ncbi:hypothetical protein GCM10027290_34370 [Micromonospora sonneratiae]|uniref:Lipoprotein n=1 Tax=Micromonospora sonneratiae TaxID=1184706 RepID=A0ABW3YH17_9ACTN
MLRAPFSSAANRLLIASALAAATLTLSACGVPPELENPGGSLPTPHSSAPTGLPPTLPGRSLPTPTAPTPTARFPEATATDCQGSPTGAQVIALLRRASNLLSANTRATVSTGPLCAGDWQYSVVQIPNREPLQVVSKGSPAALTLVTAGTDVCNIPVRVGAPTGIRFVACEQALLPTFGG